MNTDKRFWLGLVLFFVFIVFVCFLPYLFTNYSWFDLDFSDSGEVGDTIGGIMGPFIAIAASVLTFLAFWVQYQANLEQKRQFNEALEKQQTENKQRDKTWKIERFEGRFYELLKLHKANINEINIGDRVKGRKSFVPMFSELRLCYNTVIDMMKAASQAEREEHQYNNINPLSLAYTVFFFGIGVQSEKQYVPDFSTGERHLFKDVKERLEGIQKSVESTFENEPSKRFYVHDLPTNRIYDDRTVEIYYYPFDGHMNVLGHYFRHIFQTVNYVLSQDFLDDDEKYRYLKTFRAQISNFEQLMLYYNSMAWFQKEWHKIFTDYRFIKNLPLNLADFSVLPEAHFAEDIIRLRKLGKEMFEKYE